MLLDSATRKEEALWLLEKLIPGTGVNNLSFTFEVDGALDPAVLRQAVDRVLRGHQVLRTVFRAGVTGLRREVLAPEDLEVGVASLPVSTVDETLLRTELAMFVARPFTFNGAPLLRVGHVAGEGRDLCCLTVHHLVADTISGARLIADLVSAYDDALAGRAPQGEEVPALAEPEPRPESARYWREQLRGFDPGGLDLWCGRQESSGATLAGDQVTVELGAPALEAVHRLRTELNTSEAVVLLAAYSRLLAAHGAGPDLALGTMVNVRGQHRQDAVGYHVNVLPLRMTVDPAEPFTRFADRVATVFFDAIAHADMPVDSLYSEVARTGGSWRNTLFRHVFNYVPGLELGEFAIGGATARPVVVEIPYSKFDLEFFVMASANGIRLRAVYSTDVFTEAEVRDLVARYEALLVGLGEEHRPRAAWNADDHAVIDAANETAGAEPDTVLAAFHHRVCRTPDEIAVECGDESLTYQGLWAAAGGVRAVLAEAGVGAGDVVALVAPRSIELAAAVLGTWLAGAVYLPLDPDHPAHRIAYQLADSGAKAALVPPGAKIAARPGVTVLPIASTVDSSVEPPVIDRTAPAYLIYTSGSTGRPKGTLVSHHSLANLVEHFAGELAARPGEATLWMTTFSFDISALELFLPLVTGGRVVVAPDSARTDGRELTELLELHRVAIVQATPTTWRLVLPECERALAGLRVLSGGEALPPQLAHRLALTGCELRNVYGPTETTIWSTSGVIERGSGTDIGVGGPIRGTQVFVAAPDGTELPVGVRGELCIAGEGVAIGYHNRAELTVERFRDHSRYGRHYRTGDLARWRRDGTLEVLGRVDRQVKLRGNRVELGEVESVLLDHPWVEAAAVVVTGTDSTDAALIAFVVAEDKPDLVTRLWEHARAGLPPAAVPSEFLVLESLPTTGNQKVDHLALARLVEDRAPAAAAAELGGDDLVAALVGLWREVLGRDDLTAESNFFTSGGHSLLAAQLAQRVEERIGPRVDLAELFTRPTPAQLAEFLRPAN
ncbi:amino acid adenylation domain-containing protein [Allokutzneria sp. A3M-2-11 16]|uniref:non-ribosomal peptide synthetase n=1 Tax=Allokutzneria sp. A3M-2-11 16 TaxID=2962043 RepID=UPI0020B783D2|nr:non-ribosomal peptide synthetase [Allokutzneria sp. A3M-2-11 16]MCP3803250.1 amino acid adenylation domain-containing protein [Allokutzneria sp. A3M-2-11 16]